MEEEADLTEMFGQGLMEKLRRRAEKRRGKESVAVPTEVPGIEEDVPSVISGTSEVNEGPENSTKDDEIAQKGKEEIRRQVRFEPSLSATTDNLDPSSIHQKYFPNENPRPANLEWLLPANTSSSSSPSSSTSTVTATAPATRFDLSGNPLTQSDSASIPSHTGLHHHGEDSESAGYTIDEIIMLSSSSFVPQRKMMLGLLGKMVAKIPSYETRIAKELEADGVVEKGFKLSVGVLCSGEKNVGLLRETITCFHECLIALRSVPKDPEWLDTMPLDVLLDRIRGTLAASISQSVLQPLSIRQLLSTFVLLSARKITFADKIASSLVPIVTASFILLSSWPTLEQDQELAIVVEVLRLIESCTTASREATKILQSAGVFENLLRFLAIPTLSSENIMIIIQVLRIFENTARYGLNGSIVPTCSTVLPPVGMWLQTCLRDDNPSSIVCLVGETYFRLLRTWITCAIDPHAMEGEHDLIWTQVEGLGWADEAADVLTLVNEVFKGDKLIQEGPARLATACLDVLSAWTSGVSLNAVRGGEEEKTKINNLVKEVKLREALTTWAAEFPLASNGQLPLLTATLRLTRVLDPSSMPRNLPRLTDPSCEATLISMNRIDAIDLAKELLEDVDKRQSSERMSNAMNLFLQLRPGDETYAMALVDKLLDIKFTEADDVGHRHGLYILRPFFHYAVLPNLNTVVGPQNPEPKLLKLTTTLRPISRQLLTQPWMYSPIDAILNRRTSKVFEQLPPAWDASDLQLIRATLIFARVSGSLERLARGQLLMVAMKVYMLETKGAHEYFRDEVVERELKLIMALCVTTTPTALEPSFPTEGALPSATTLYQFYNELLDLYEGVSFGDSTFGQVIYPLLAQRYPRDYRMCLWTEHQTALRSLRHKVSEIPLETGSLASFFETPEEDLEILMAYAGALPQLGPTSHPFLHLVVTYHLSKALKSTTFEEEAKRQLKMAVDKVPNQVSEIMRFDTASIEQGRYESTTPIGPSAGASTPQTSTTPLIPAEREHVQTRTSAATSIPSSSVDESPTTEESSPEEAKEPFFAPSPLEDGESKEGRPQITTYLGSEDAEQVLPLSTVKQDAELGFWERSKQRARSDRSSWDYVLRSGIAGGIAGCVAKTAIAPLDRVKILFQTSNVDFKPYAGTPLGLFRAIGHIWRTQGPIGLLQGHSATLLRIFPYAAIKFMAYERLDAFFMPTQDMRTPGRFFLAGSLSGVASVCATYPLELIRVRLAFQTRKNERTNLRQIVRQIYLERIISHPPILRSLAPFYRGFSVTLIGMVPYAGTSFLTYGTLKRYLPQYIPALKHQKTVSDLACGAVAGAVSQTASYPFEVVRRRMQVGGRKALNFSQAVSMIYRDGGARGFFVGLSIGYLKVVPMTSLSFTTWQFMKRHMDI